MKSFFKIHKIEIFVIVLTFLAFIVLFSFLKDNLDILVIILIGLSALVSFFISKKHEITYVKLSIGLIKKEIIASFFKEMIQYFVVFISYLAFIYLFDFINREYTRFLWLDLIKNMLILFVSCGLFSAVGIIVPKYYKYLCFIVLIAILFTFIYFIYLK